MKTISLVLLMVLGGVGCGRSNNVGGYHYSGYGQPRFTYQDHYLRQECGGNYVVNPYSGSVNHVFCGHNGGYVNYNNWWQSNDSYYYYDDTHYYFYWRF